MEAPGEGAVAQQALAVAGKDTDTEALVGKDKDDAAEALVVVEKQGGSTTQPSAEGKEATTASEEPLHEEKKKKKLRKGDDKAPPASAEEDEAGKDKAPASPEMEEAGKRGNNDKQAPYYNKEDAGKKRNDDDDDEPAKGDDDKAALASPEEDEAAKGDNDDDDKAPESADAQAANPADAVAPHLPLDTVVVIISRLPSKEAVRCALLSKACENRLRENLFFNAHLAPRRRDFLHDDAPNMLLLQPTGRGSLRGYSHLTILRRRSGGSDVVYRMPIRTEDEEYYLYENPNLPQPQPMSANFFSTTFTELDLSVMACEGRLLLGRSGKHGCLFVCNPTQERFIRLPNPLLDIDSSRTVVAGIHYKLGPWGEMVKFSVVLMMSTLPAPGPHNLTVQHFSSDGKGMDRGWVVVQIEDEEISAVLQGVSAPGIYDTVTESFYWINGVTGTIIGYDLNTHHLFPMAPPPPETEAHPIRKGWALGSADGRLRVSCFSVSPEVEEEPFVQIDMGGLLSVWTRDEAVWISVKHVLLPVIWMLDFFRRIEVPVDAAQADPRFILVKQDNKLLRRDVEDGVVELVSNLYANEDPYLHRMYEAFHSFFIFL